MKEIEYGEFLRLDGGEIVRYGEKQDIRVENNRYIDYSGEYEWETRIVNHSSNIIDLIEAGDYVNGWKVLSIVTTLDKPNEIGFKFLGFDNLLYDIDIKSICTKEQFAAVEYKPDN